MAQFTCINCQVAFKDVDMQREHYKTDWHRYNLKRRVAELLPVTAEEFVRRIVLIKQENENKAKGKNYTYCTVCKKSFASNQSFQNHLQSKRHTDLSQVKNVNNDDNIGQPSVKNQNAVGQKLGFTEEEFSDDDSIETASSDTETVDSDEWDEITSENNPILNNDCLFCSHHSASLTKNVKHMSVAHSFFIPHIEYLADLKGLLLYLGEKICQGYLCIWCNDRKNCFSSVEAARNHMVDKGHTKIPSDTEASLEYLDFYNFNVDSDEDEDDDDVELPDMSNANNSPTVTDKFGKSISNIEDTDAVTMLLPSGEVICHRSLIRYFKQNPMIVKKKLHGIKENKVQKLINYYRGLGWNPTQKESVKKKVRDIKYIHYIQSKYETKLKVKANKLQKHFRPQVDF